MAASLTAVLSNATGRRDRIAVISSKVWYAGWEPGAVIHDFDSLQAGIQEVAGRGVRLVAYHALTPSKPHATRQHPVSPLAFCEPDFYQLPGQRWPIALLLRLPRDCLFEQASARASVVRPAVTRIVESPRGHYPYPLLWGTTSEALPACPLAYATMPLPTSYPWVDQSRRLVVSVVVLA